MRRPERNAHDAEVRRELETIDRVLAGAQTGDEDASLVRLSRTLVALRPGPTPEFVRALDARAASGFERPRSRSRSAFFGRMPRWGMRPAAGIAVACALLVAVVVVASPFGSASHPAPRPPSPAVASGTASAPEKGTESSTTGATAATAPAPATAASSAPNEQSSAGGPARQVEHAAVLDVGLPGDQIQSASQRVFTIVSSFGGYVRQSSVSSGTAGQPETAEQGGASFDIRIPSARLTSAIATLSHLGHVRSENDSTNDVTEQYDSLASAVRGTRAEQSSLLKQLAAAGSAERAAEIEARLRDVDARLARLQGEQRALQARLAFTPLALTLTPERAQGGAAAGGLTPGQAAGTAGEILEAALGVLLIAAAAALPLSLAALAGAGLLAAGRRQLRERALDAS